MVFREFNRIASSLFSRSVPQSDNATRRTVAVIGAGFEHEEHTHHVRYQLEEGEAEEAKKSKAWLAEQEREQASMRSAISKRLEGLQADEDVWRSNQSRNGMKSGSKNGSKNGSRPQSRRQLEEQPAASAAVPAPAPAPTPAPAPAPAASAASARLQQLLKTYDDMHGSDDDDDGEGSTCSGGGAETRSSMKAESGSASVRIAVREARKPEPGFFEKAKNFVSSLAQKMMGQSEPDAPQHPGSDPSVSRRQPSMTARLISLVSLGAHRAPARPSAAEPQLPAPAAKRRGSIIMLGGMHTEVQAFAPSAAEPALVAAPQPPRRPPPQDTVKSFTWAPPPLPSESGRGHGLPDAIARHQHALTGQQALAPGARPSCDPDAIHPVRWQVRAGEGAAEVPKAARPSDLSSSNVPLSWDGDAGGARGSGARPSLEVRQRKGAGSNPWSGPGSGGTDAMLSSSGTTPLAGMCAPGMVPDVPASICALSAPGGMLVDSAPPPKSGYAAKNLPAWRQLVKARTGRVESHDGQEGVDLLAEG